MPDDRPRGSCLIDGCSRDPYPREDGRLPLVCGPDVSHLVHMLRETPTLADDLANRDTPGGALIRAERRERVLPWRIPLALGVRLVQVEEVRVADELPAAMTAGAPRGGRVSGSPEPRLPVNPDVVDLLSPARSVRRVVDEDQVGLLPVASTLDFWAEDLRQHRNRGERRPDPSITVLAGWLADRVEEAVDDWYPVDEFFDQIRAVYGSLRAQLGIVDVPDHKAGVHCPRCYAQRLVQLGGEILVRCQACPAVLLESEYHEHVKTMARKVNRVRLNKATVSINGGETRLCTLQITTHMVDVSTFSGVTKPDPAWTYVDAAGHFHAWDHEGRLPTLQERTEWVAYAEPDEDTGETGYETSTMHCRLCGVQVEPATVTTHDLGKQMAPGRTEWLIEFDGPAPYECSVVVRTPDKVFFGVANCYERSMGRTTAVGISMSWRKAPKEPEPSVVPAA